jgi:hypothetical protein
VKSNDAPVLVVKSTPDITPEQARDVRARAWAFVFQCWQEKKKGGPDTAPDGVMKGFGISEKEKGGQHVEHLPHRSSEIVH